MMRMQLVPLPLKNPMNPSCWYIRTSVFQTVRFAGTLAVEAGALEAIVGAAGPVAVAAFAVAGDCWI